MRRCERSLQECQRARECTWAALCRDWTRSRFQLCFCGNCNHMHFLCYWFVQFCASSCVGEKQSRVVFWRGCCLSPRGSVTLTGCLPESPSAGPGAQTSLPDQSSLFLTWHVCCSQPGGCPAGGPACRLPLGPPCRGSGCRRSQGLLFWHPGFVWKSSTPPLGSTKC